MREPFEDFEEREYAHIEKLNQNELDNLLSAMTSPDAVTKPHISPSEMELKLELIKIILTTEYEGLKILKDFINNYKHNGGNLNVNNKI